MRDVCSFTLTVAEGSYSYAKLIIDLREMALGYFGFNSSLYGTKKNVVTRKLKWLTELYRIIKGY